MQPTTQKLTDNPVLISHWLFIGFKIANLLWVSGIIFYKIFIISIMQFLKELQIHWFWILKGYGIINCHKEFDRDVWNTFCVTWIEKLKILQRMYKLISTLATQKPWKPISPQLLYPMSQKFHQLLSFIGSLNICSHFLYSTKSC